MSFVSLVIREDVLNLSRFTKEKFCILSSISFLISVPKPIDAFDEQIVQPAPPIMPKKAITIISIPREII